MAIRQPHTSVWALKLVLSVQGGFLKPNPKMVFLAVALSSARALFAVPRTYQIARILNGKGWPTRNAKQWHGSHVSAILKRLKVAK